jgi:hypothetical protein
MLWIAASGVLLASGSTLADTDRPIDSGYTLRADEAKTPPAPSADATMADLPVDPAQDLWNMQPAEVRPEEKAGPSPYAVTVDPAPPGSEFPWGG